MGNAINPAKTVEVRLDTAALVGKADLINGVFGSSRRQAGVVGVSESFVGVSGDGRFIGVNGISRNGTGVSGESDSAFGIGVHGKGGRLAGLFEGNVEVTGSLTVRGADLSTLLDRINRLAESLQNSANENLSNRVAELEREVGKLKLEISALVSQLGSHVHI